MQTHKFSIEELKIGALAARNFPKFYQRTPQYKGNPCPAEAMSRVGYGYNFTSMCDLLWHAAGMPSEPDRITFLKRQYHLDRYYEESVTPRYWLQNTLHFSPEIIAGIFDSIITCSDPTWSSLSPPETIESLNPLYSAVDSNALVAIG